MIIKGRSLAMRHASRTHRVALDRLFDRINLDTKIQIKYIDTKNQLADILTNGNFTRDEWNHLLCLFNISHFSSTNCLEVMSERTQEDASEERGTAKSKPMMHLGSRYSAKDPNVLASTASQNPQNRSESQIPLSSWNEQQPRTERPVMGASSSDYSEWNIDEKWSSQEWKSGEMLEARTVRPVDDKFVMMIWILTPSQNRTFLDKFHTIYSIRRKTSRRKNVVREETDKTAGNIQARSLMARTLNEIGKKCNAERKA